MSKNNILPDLLLRKRNQRKNARILQMNNTPNGIVESGYVKIGDIDQWITIRGENRQNPILLFVHGGPGSTYSIFNPLLRGWEKYFTIVQWDQRGAGKTFRMNGMEGSGSISYNRLAQDGIELSEYLCSKLDQPKLILIGSSVGSVTGVVMAAHRPDLFYAYIGTDQNSPDPEHISYQIMLDAFRAVGSRKGAQLVEKMGNEASKWSREETKQRNQLLVKAITGVPNMIMDLILPSMISSPEHKVRDIMDIFKGMDYSFEEMYHDMLHYDITELGFRFELPFFIFQGDRDIITPTETAKMYFDKLEAPYKEFVLIREAGHLACFARPDQFLEELIQRVRPLMMDGELIP